MENIDKRRELLLEKVIELHGEQKRKYSNTPYWKHPLKVARKVDSTHPLAWEVGVCHDLLEDTPIDESDLKDVIKGCGYSESESFEINASVIDLTDIFTKENYPDLNRANRKKFECKRLSNVSWLSKTVKYADIIDNTQDIISNDPEFSKVYLKEINDLLEGMRDGDFDLFREACYHVEKGLQTLKLK